ncbi:MAG: BatA domain-containing protein [Algoriphagus sp.]|nr:BatA domain-containing protein [Algoriphagus sp.]
MEFLQPIFFWALVGISVPILIHLWNGRRGKVLDWAAMNWLSGQDSQSSRSFKLEHPFLLLLRILLWIVLVLLAVGIWFDFFQKSESKPIVHLVQPIEAVEEEFRFEIGQALSKGEQVFWLAEGLPAYEMGIQPPARLLPSLVQKALDLLPNLMDSLHVYTSGMESDFGSNLLFVPQNPVFHVSNLITGNFSKEKIALDSVRFLSVNERGLLQLNSPEDGIPVVDPVFFGPVNLSISLDDEEKKKAFLAAFEAIEEVYGLKFAEESEGEKLVVTVQVPETVSKEKFYLIAESKELVLLENAVNLELQSGMAWEELIEKGLLPELILEPLVDFLGIHPQEKRLSQPQLEQRFIKIPDSGQAHLPNSILLLLGLFFVLFVLERHMAYRLNL